VANEIDLINQHLDAAKASINAAQAIVNTLPPPEPTDPPIEVKPGDNLLSVLEQAPEGATVVIDPAFEADLNWWSIKKPVTILGKVPVAPGRIRPEAVLPTLRGYLTIECPNVTLGSLRMTGKVRNATLIATGPNSTFERLVLLGSPDGQHRGIAMNDPDVKVLRCHIANIWSPDQDTQAVCSWSGGRNCLVEDNYLEASGENIIFGGSDSVSEDKIPQDILCLNNDLYKPFEWKALASCKNLYELKNGKRITLRGGTMEYSFVDSQTGYAMQLTVRASVNTNPWSTIEDCTIEDVTIRHMCSGANFLGIDTTPERPSKQMTRMTLRRITFEDINPQVWGAGQGRQLQMLAGSEGTVIEDCTFHCANGALGNSGPMYFDSYDKPHTNFRFTGNRVYEGTYGVFGAKIVSGATHPIRTLEHYCPGYIWENNTVIRTVPTKTYQYPPGTTIEAEAVRSTKRTAAPAPEETEPVADLHDDTPLVTAMPRE
jgi:hypothetical protein